MVTPDNWPSNKSVRLLQVRTPSFAIRPNGPGRHGEPSAATQRKAQQDAGHRKRQSGCSSETFQSKGKTEKCSKYCIHVSKDNVSQQSRCTSRGAKEVCIRFQLLVT
ncbi:hypothetical protein X975_22426, partial [Stegodyphus mimosarum]